MYRDLRVALVSDGLYPYFAGGKEVRLWQLARRLVRPGISVEVHTMRWWALGRREAAGEWRGIRLRGLCRSWTMYSGSRRSIWQAAMFAFGSLRLAAARADVIDADHMPYLHILPLWLVSRLRRVPLVVTWHEWWGREYWQEYMGPLGIISAALEKMAARMADHLVVDSHETYERLFRQGIPAGRMSLLPLGADLEAIAAAPPAATRWDVMYAGRFVAHKRVRVLLEALALLAEEGREPSCVLVGSGPERDLLQQQAESLGLRSVCFVPTLPDQADVWGLMKASRVFVYPSVREGFGLAVLEAQAAGATVVTTDHPDNHARRLVDDGSTGYLCGTSPADLARAIGLALDRPAEPGALATHVAGYAWGPRADRLAGIYRSVLKDGGRR